MQRTSQIKQSTAKENSLTKHLSSIKTANCKSLSGKSTIGYAIGHNEKKELFLWLTSNSGGGFFSKSPVAYEDVANQLEVCPEGVTSSSLAGLYRGRSSNGPGFMLAALMNEGLLRPSTTKKRCYELLETGPFLDEMNRLMESGGEKPVRKRKAPQPKKSAPET
ncbi:MAG: hypothetical protein HOE44_06805 [Candidatus Marinimicrobia bacterium]|nr:hypothetical protein [Candidatus Neomarinimicrobiota bacterium]